MARISKRTYSRYTQEAISLLGRLVRAGRVSRKLTTQELAERAGISRDMLYRIEKGDPRCEIGATFEVAAIVGVSLFEPELSRLSERNQAMDEKLTLLPKSVRRRKLEVKDDF
ncbi:MAG: helix-turn-helix transcriptional regulator [Proteobacteria bacterium]|nr:helix-turn-helix transcriptional regulator [Pseudomonadota bacterium]